MVCGKEFETFSNRAYNCKECEDSFKLTNKLKVIDSAAYSLTHIKARMRTKLKIDISKEVEIIKNRVKQGEDSFSSKPEAMVAIQLEKRKIRYINQKDVNGRKVDFFLPDLKIFLEIDGELYHNDEDKEFLRDRQIMSSIPNDYEIVHLKASCIPRHTWKLDLTLPALISWRNEKYRFRDCTLDTEYLMNINFNMNRRGNT